MRDLLSGIRRGRAQSARACGPHHATVLAVAAQKGGVGKTTTAVNLARALVEAGERVLLLDVDPQAHVAASLRAVLQPGPVTLSQILLADEPRDLMDAVVPTRIDGLSVTPTDKGLHEAENRLAALVGRETLLQAALVTARTWFDTILIDCPPNLGNLTLNALLAADAVLIPCDMSMLAVEGVADLLGTVETVNLRLRHPLDVLGIVRTRVDARNRSVNDTVGQVLTDNFGELVLDTAVPVNSALAKAQAAGQAILDFEPRARGTAAYRALAGEVRALAADRATS